MNIQMFPPNNTDNSFEWFRNQNRLHESTLNQHENMQYQNELARYYGNVIQPYPQNQSQGQVQPVQSHQPQPVQMMETSPYGHSAAMGQQAEGLHTNGGEVGGMMLPMTYEFNHAQQLNYQYPPTSQYQNFSPYQMHHQGEGITGYPPNGVTQNQTQNPHYQMLPIGNPGNQLNYQVQQVTNYQMQNYPGFEGQQQQQMMQGGSGPFSTPAMFAPSTPYPTQPKQINQQTNSSQSFQISSLLNQFKNSSGSYDVPKMMSTAGQVMNTMNQVGGIFKQIGFFFK